MSDFLQTHGLQHSRLPCPSPTPGADPYSCPSRQWCLPIISSSVVPFWEYLQMTSSQVNVCREWSRDGYLQPLWIFTTPTLLRLWRVTWAYSGPPFLRKKVVRRNVHEQTLEKRGMSQCTALTVEGRQASTGKGMKVSALQEGLESTVP